MAANFPTGPFEREADISLGIFMLITPWLHSSPPPPPLTHVSARCFKEI
jgi:hypothetical protein